MMLAGQAVAALDLRQHAADHGAQRVLHDFIVGNQAVADVFTHGRGGWTARARRSSGESRLATRKIGSMECAMRTATVQRTTKETDIAIPVDLAGSGNYSVANGIGFRLEQRREGTECDSTWRSGWEQDNQTKN